MSQIHDATAALARLERLRELGYRCDAAARELTANGFEERAIAEGLRAMNAWMASASALKTSGLPYEDIVVHLQEMFAGWADVATALMAAGLTGADVLRTLLPVTEEAHDVWSVVQVAVCRSPETAGFTELGAVLRFYGIDAEEAISHFAGPFGTKEEAERRLGIS